MLLQETLKSAIDKTPAQIGLIGLIDIDSKELNNVWHFQSGLSSPLPINSINLQTFTEISQDALGTLLFENRALTTLLGLPKKYIWHYLILSEVSQDRYSLLVLHLESPHDLADQEIRYLANLNENAIEKLQKAFLYEDFHTDFISFVTHELRNHLTVINSYADIMRKGITGEINSQQLEYLTTIIQNVKRMERFIRDLSAQPYFETEPLQLELKTTPVQEVLTEVLNSYDAQINKKSLDVSFKLNDSMPNMICDRTRIIQILSNLLSNAIKYTPEGGTIELGVEHIQNKWDKTSDTEAIHFWVKDTGYGISKNDQSRIFSKFYRGSDERIKRISGSGLGLSISKSLVEMMGGKMWCESIKDIGSTFHFTISI